MEIENVVRNAKPAQNDRRPEDLCTHWPLLRRTSWELRSSTRASWASSLKQQKGIELQHLTELALGIVKEEHAAAQKGDIAVADAQKRALARVAALRYGSNDYFWVNDMQPRMVMHPIKPEMNGSDISDFKDPNGKTLFVDMVNVVKKDGAGFVPISGQSPASTGHSRSCPMSPASLHGTGSSAPASISTTSMHRPGHRPSVPC